MPPPQDNKRSGRVTMKDIAEAAGVSVMTVSLAFRNNPRITEGTKEKVMEAVQRLNYQPDPALSALVAYRSQVRTPAYSGTIAFLNAYPKQTMYRERRLHREYFEAATAHAQTNGYRLEPVWLGDPDMPERRLRQILKNRGIRGILVAPMPSIRTTLEDDWQDFAVVALGYSLTQPGFDRVGTSQFNSILECMKQLRALGYRRIGYLDSTVQEERTGGRWVGAFMAYQLQYLPKKDWVRPMLGLLPPAARRAWMKKERPDVVLSAFSSMFDTFQEMGLRVPEDVGFVFPFYHELFPKHTCFRENTQRIAEVAVDHLIHKLNASPSKTKQSHLNLMVDGIWCPGTSTRRVDNEHS